MDSRQDKTSFLATERYKLFTNMFFMDPGEILVYPGILLQATGRYKLVEMNCNPFFFYCSRTDTNMSTDCQVQDSTLYLNIIQTGFLMDPGHILVCPATGQYKLVQIYYKPVS